MNGQGLSRYSDDSTCSRMPCSAVAMSCYTHAMCAANRPAGCVLQWGWQGHSSSEVAAVLNKVGLGLLGSMTRRS